MCTINNYYFGFFIDLIIWFPQVLILGVKILFMSGIHFNKLCSESGFFVMETNQEELIPECCNQIIYFVLWSPDLAWSTSYSVADGTVIQSHTGWSFQCYLLLNKNFMTHTFTRSVTPESCTQIHTRARSNRPFYGCIDMCKIYHTSNSTLRAVLMCLLP